MRAFKMGVLAVASGLVVLVVGCGRSQVAPESISGASAAATSGPGPRSSGVAGASAWVPDAADQLWPCSLVPTSVMRELGVNAPSGLQGTSFTPGQVYSCSLVNAAHDASVTVNVGSAAPSGGTAGYSRTVLDGTIAAWQEVKSAASMGATGDGWDVFIQVLVNGDSGNAADFYGGVGCSTCTKIQAITMARQVAAVAVPAEHALGGAPPAGTQVTSY
jgi:hypothetical protein